MREQQACIWAANNNRPWPSAWLSPLLHSPPFPADHLLECQLATNHGSRPLGRTHTRAQWDVSLPSLSAATRYSRIACAATVADSLSPMTLVSPSATQTFSVSEAFTKRRSLLMYTEPWRFTIFCMGHPQSGWRSGYRPTQVPVMHAEMRVAIWRIWVKD